MFVQVLDLEGNYAGDLNLENVTLIKLIPSHTTQPNTVEVTDAEGTEEYKISKTAYQKLQAYLGRNGIS